MVVINGIAMLISWDNGAMERTLNQQCLLVTALPPLKLKVPYLVTVFAGTKLATGKKCSAGLHYRLKLAWEGDGPTLESVLLILNKDIKLITAQTTIVFVAIPSLSDHHHTNLGDAHFCFLGPKSV